MKIISITLACSCLDPARYPATPWAEVAVSGRSNVGKSSLLNTLLGGKGIARISKQPGKTRTVNFYRVNDRFFLVDLPGYGYAQVPAEMRMRWRRIIYLYIEARKTLAGVVQLVDARHPPMRDDLVLMQRLVDAGRPFVVAMTKADKIGRSKRRLKLLDFASHFDGMTVGLYGEPHEGGRTRDGSGERTRTAGSVDIPVLFFSSRTGEGREKLWRWIESRIV